MSWAYTQDNRTHKKVEADYLKGKKAEKLIIEKLSELTEVELINNKDKFGSTGEYRPDIHMLYKGEMRPVEIKWTDKDLDTVDWKLNQYEWAKTCNGMLLQVSGKKCCLIKITDKKTLHEKGYCNKPVARFKPNWGNSFSALLI